MASKIASRILTSAVSCFSAKGYSGTSTKEIALAADVTEGSVFRLFGSKEALFEAALANSQVTGCISLVEIQRFLADGDFERAIRRATLAFFDRASMEWVRLITYASLERPDSTNGLVFRRQDITDAVAARIQRAIHEGVTRTGVVPELAAMQLRAVVYFLRAYAGLGQVAGLKTKRAQRAAMELSVDTWLEGVLARYSDGSNTVTPGAQGSRPSFGR